MADEKYLAPPWIKYPYAPKESSFWKDGSGAEYLIKYKEYVKDTDDYDEMFPKAITFTGQVTPSDNLSDNFKNYLKSPKKPLFIKLWTPDAKPKYNPEYVKCKYTIMYDTIFTEKKHIPVGKDHFHSIGEIITLVKESIKQLDLTENEYEQLWDEIKYTVYLNALYYKLTDDINLIKEIIKMEGRIIACYSDNLEFGVQEKDDDTLVGDNLMGLAMMEFRDHIIDVYRHYEDIDWDLSGKPHSVEMCRCLLHNH
jgi:hypothetical protein